MQDTRCTSHVARCALHRIQDTGYGIQDTGRGVQRATLHVAWVGSWELLLLRCGHPLGAFGADNGDPSGDFWTPLIPKWLKKVTFEGRSALGPFKNELCKGGFEKHEHLMKNQCENRCSLMAQNSVWRYTLRLFHTFAVFEKIKELMQQGMPNVVIFGPKADLERSRVD